MKSCLNLEQLLTTLEVTGEKLSEPGATSDNFGDNRLKSCLNLEQLLTTLEVTGEKLSEPGATSDNFGGNR